MSAEYPSASVITAETVTASEDVGVVGVFEILVIEGAGLPES